jgi:4-amino-4-deoxy-L-arabinose transferase-like glycosyltransferase
VILGAALAAIEPGTGWVGWIGFSVLLALGLAALIAAWRWSGGTRSMAWMIGLALALRLAAGAAAYLALPVNGYDEPDDRAGYIFTDAHRRDDQAWELAQSGRPLSAAFDKTFYTDQYGGLLAMSALTYKVFSPDAHRPLMVVALAALVAALGIPFLFQAARLLWQERLAAVAAWLSVLYPESVLTGGAQMREPFLLTFIAVALWGFAIWLHNADHKAWIWIGIGLLGMLLVSPGIGLGMLVLLGGWLWSRGEHRRLPWPVIVAAAAILLIGVLFLAWSVSRQSDFSSTSPVGLVLNWFRDSVKWVIYQLEQGSGQIQRLFRRMNPLAQFFFVVGYGIAQPVLPPAFFEPTTLTWRIIAVLRAVGWYALLPLLLYAPIAAWQTKEAAPRRTWLWLSLFSWAWIAICAVRAGGDQWDNPRYRLIFFAVEALAAAFAWTSWRERRSAWLPRIAGLELVCVLLFGQWYLARYYLIGIHLPVAVVVAVSLSLVVLIFLGGWLWDSLRARRRQI